MNNPNDTNDNVVPLHSDAEDKSVNNDSPTDELTAHPSPVGSEVFDDFVNDLVRYVFIGEEQAIMGVFWAAHADAFDEFEHTPRLVITAPMKKCGKTTLLSVLQEATDRSLGGDNMTPACYFRLASSGQTVFFLDEADVWFGKRNGDPELTAALNGGYQKRGVFWRASGDAHVPTPYPTHASVALAGIKLDQRLPTQILDRSLVIRMERAGTGDLAQHFKSRKHLPIFRKHGERLKRWVNENRQKIRDHGEPKIPEEVDDRDFDNWEPLLTIAEVASPEWGNRLRNILLNQVEYDDEDLGTHILQDIRRVHDNISHGLTKIPVDGVSIDAVQPEPMSMELGRITELGDNSVRFWSRLHANLGYREEQDTRIKGKDVTRLLKPFGIKKKTVRYGTGEKDVIYGFQWKELLAAQERYAPMPPEYCGIERNFEPDDDGLPYLSSREVVVEGKDGLEVVRLDVPHAYVPGEDREEDDELPF